MSTFVPNVLDQDTIVAVQNKSRYTKTHMQKNMSFIEKITQSFQNLIPYIGVLLVVAGIIGLLFIQNPLKESQDPRKSAQVQTWPNISSHLRVPFVINRTGEIAFYLNNQNYTFTRVRTVFTLLNNSLQTPEIIVNQGSGFDAESIEVEQITGGYLISVVAIPNNLDWLIPPEDTSFIRVRAIAQNSGTLTVAFDQDRTYASTPALEILINVPSPSTYTITGTSSTQQQLCLQSGGVWREFTDGCVDSCEYAANPGGTACTTVLTMGCDCGRLQCWNGNSCINNPGTTPPPTIWPSPPVTPRPTPTVTPTPTGSPSPTPSVSPTPTPPVVQSCNQSCTNNSQCAVNLFCYPTTQGGRCRLATNPTSTSCQADDQSSVRQCNEFCTSNAECKTGLTCWNNYCRNPENPENNQCLALTTQQRNQVAQQCGQTCASNADCAINLRCYEGQCRLATNPSSTSCSTTTTQTVSNTYANKIQNATNEADIAKSDTPVKDTENALPDDGSSIASDTGDRKDETLWDLFKSLIANSDSKLPFFTILLGALLLIVSILVALFRGMRKPQTAYSPKSDSHKIDVETFDIKSNLENHQKD